MRFLLAFAQGGLLSPLLPLLRETFQVSPGELGLLTSMPGISSVVMDVVATYLLRRRPLLSLLLQSIGLTAIALLGSMLAPSFYWLIITQMLLGLGVSMGRVASLMVVVAGTPRTEQGRANSLLEFSAIAGFMLSPTLSGLAASLIHWRVAFGLGLVFVGGAFAWVLYTRQALAEAVKVSEGRGGAAPDADSQATPSSAGPVAEPYRPGAILIAYVATFVMSFIWSGFIATAMPLFGGEEVGLSTSTLGLVFTAGLLVDFILLLPMGWLSDRLECRVVLTPALLLMAAALTWLPHARSLESLLVVSICLHTGFAAWGMPSAALALFTPRARLARTMGIYRLLVDGAVVVAPWLIGTLIELYGYGPPAWLAAACVTLTALLVAQGLRAARCSPPNLPPLERDV
jgi:MFS family permease